MELPGSCLHEPSRLVAHTFMVLFMIPLQGAGPSDITPVTLFDFEEPFDAEGIETSNSSVKLVTTKMGRALQMRTSPNADLPSIFLKLTEEHCDFSSYEYIEMDVRNIGNQRVTVWCRILPKRPRTRHMGSVTLEKGESGRIRLILSRSIVPIRKKNIPAR